MIRGGLGGGRQIGWGLGYMPAIPSVGGPFGGHATLGTGLLGGWKFNETSGTQVTDVLGLNHGTNTGATIDQAGKIGRAYKYVDSTDFVDFGEFSALWNGTNNKASFVCGFKADDVSVGAGIMFAKSSNLTAERFVGFYMNVLTDGKVRCWIGGTTTTNYRYWTTNDNIVTGDDTWYQIVVTLDLSTTTCIIYVNSTAYATTLTSNGSAPTVFASNAITLKMARLRNGDATYGGMGNGFSDEGYIYNKILTADEVTDFYASGAWLSY